MNALLVLQAVATGVVLTVLIYLLVRTPSNVPLRAITVTIASFSLIVVFGTTAADGTTVLGLAPIVSRLIQHLGMCVGAYSLITFFLFSALERDVARRKAMRQAIPLVVAILLVIGSVALMPAAARSAAAMLAFTRPAAGPLEETTTRLLYLIPNLYTDYAFINALVWTRRYARGAEPRLRHGMAITSVGLAALVFGSSIFVVAIVLQWAGVAVPLMMFGIALLGIVPGSVVFMVGLAYPAVRMRLAALRVWWQHRRLYHRLGPLWTLLHQEFPEDAFGRVPAGRWRDTLSLRGVHRRYYRRVIECRDGLVRVSPYLSTNGHNPSLAEQLRVGLRARASGVPAPSRAVPVAIPAADGLDADVRELVSLSEALRRA